MGYALRQRRYAPFTLITVLLGTLVSITTVRAASIVYTFSGIGSGSIGGSDFTDAAFTIQVLADTTGVHLTTGSFPVLAVEDISSTLAIQGFQTATFTEGERVFVSQSGQILGFGRSEFRSEFPGRDLLDIMSPTFATYDLRRAFGPLAAGNPSAVWQNLVEGTTLGGVTFYAAKSITFTASLVPEPSGTIPVALAVGLTIARRRAAVRRSCGSKVDGTGVSQVHRQGPARAADSRGLADDLKSGGPHDRARVRFSF
jgi:hypothetical protein